MTQMLHNTFKQYTRPTESFRLGEDAVMLCGSCSIKGNEWYDAAGTRREVGVMRTQKRT